MTPKQEEFKTLVRDLYGTQTAAAVELGVNKATLWAWYNGRRNIPVVVMRYMRLVSFHRSADGLTSAIELAEDRARHLADQLSSLRSRAPGPADREE